MARRKQARRSFPRLRRVARSFRRTRGPLSTVRRKMTTVFHGAPKWTKPSAFTAYTGVANGTFQLVFTPTANGDSWVRRLKNGYANFQTTKNPLDILGDDGVNDALSIAAAQLSENSPKAIATVFTYGVVAGIERWFGM